MGSFILVNGIQSQSIPANDRGLAYGDGVFRTLLLRGGTPLHWESQYRKLAQDCAALNLSCPAQVLLAAELGRLGQYAGDLVAKIIVTRGAGERGYRYREGDIPNRILMASPLPPDRDTHAAEGIRARRCRLTLAHQPALAGVKHLNRLENVLARAEWQDAQIAEGILCDGEGSVISGTMTNVFAVYNGMLATPSLTDCGVAGVTRERVLDAARQHGFACDVRTISWEELTAADEIFLVNSVAGVWPVRELEGRSWPAGRLTRAVQTWLEAG